MLFDVFTLLKKTMYVFFFIKKKRYSHHLKMCSNNVYSFVILNRDCNQPPRWRRLYALDVGGCTRTNSCRWVFASKREHQPPSCHGFVSMCVIGVLKKHLKCSHRVLTPTSWPKGGKVLCRWPAVRDTPTSSRCSLTAESTLMNMTG